MNLKLLVDSTYEKLDSEVSLVYDKNLRDATM